MIISKTMVEMWIDQFERLPPDTLEGYSLEARIAWAILKRRYRE